MDKLFKFTVILFIQYLVVVNSERTRDKMYDAVSGASCFRRLNGTHQTGCSSASSGSVGVLHLINSTYDFDFIINSPPSPPYAPIIPPHLFTRENILRLKHEAKENVSVILVINKNEQMTQFSHELSCPNKYSNLNTSVCEENKPETLWNPVGSGLLHEDFPFPIYYIADPVEIDKIINCFKKFNDFEYDTHKTRSLCSIEMKTFMSAAVSSEVCMRRTNIINNLSPTKYCDPLEGKNIYGTLFPRDIMADENHKRVVNITEKFILVTCRLDTTSMFDGVGLGAMDSLVSYTTFINIAHTLAKLIPAKEDLNVLFVVFNGESYDYIGSQRFVYDLKRQSFPTKNTKTNPISFENIEFMLDLGILDDVNNINMYTLTDNNIIENLINKINVYSQNFELNINFNEIKTDNLPPTSAQSFLRENRLFPAVIANSKPTNKYYHSVYDDATNIGYKYGKTSLDYTKLMDPVTAKQIFNADSIQMKIRNVSTALALGLYELITKKVYIGKEIANPILVDEFLHCFLESADCPLFKASSHPNSLIGLPIPPMRYISVGAASHESAGWSYRVLGFLLSQKVSNRTKDNCTHLPLHWFSAYDDKGECRLTTQNYSHAMSPAFLIDDYDWKSGKYSTWTESTWSEFSARIFLRPSKIHEAVTLAIGIVVLILSFCLVFLINSRSEVLFENAPSSSMVSEPAAC